MICFILTFLKSATSPIQRGLNKSDCGFYLKTNLLKITDKIILPFFKYALET